MRRISKMLVLVAAMALGLATLTAAQMMGGNQGHMMRNTDSTSQSHPMMQRADSLSTQMSNHWNITQAARLAKVNRSTFVSRMRRLGIAKKK